MQRRARSMQSNTVCTNTNCTDRLLNEVLHIDKEKEDQKHRWGKAQINKKKVRQNHLTVNDGMDMSIECQMIDGLGKVNDQLLKQNNDKMDEQG